MIDISPGPNKADTGKLSHIVVQSKDENTGEVSRYRTKHVVIAAGGRPNLPSAFRNTSAFGEKVIHASQYMMATPIEKSFPDGHRIAVVGGGQSGAEIFKNVQERFPKAQASLLIRSSALKPRDESPLYVNQPTALDGHLSMLTSSQRERGL